MPVARLNVRNVKFFELEPFAVIDDVTTYSRSLAATMFDTISPPSSLAHSSLPSIELSDFTVDAPEITNMDVALLETARAVSVPVEYSQHFTGTTLSTTDSCALPPTNETKMKATQTIAQIMITVPWSVCEVWIIEYFGGRIAAATAGFAIIEYRT